MKSQSASILLGTVMLAVVASGSAIARDRDRNHDHGRWDQLGCQKVGFLVDRDVIRVGRGEGKFKALRLNVSGNDVFINDLKVVYGNGAPDDIPVRTQIRQGGQSGLLDLKGRGERAIDRVELTYRAKPNFKGSATVCVSGLT